MTEPEKAELPVFQEWPLTASQFGWLAPAEQEAQARREVIFRELAEAHNTDPTTLRAELVLEGRPRFVVRPK